MAAPLQFELVTLPLGHGADESADERAAPAAKLAWASNAEIDHSGAIQKRRGYHKTSHTLPSTTKRLFSTGRELCALTDRYLYAIDVDSGRTYERGRIAPCAGRTTTVLRDEFDWRYCDAIAGGESCGYVLVAGQRRSEWTPGSVYEMTDVVVLDATQLQTIHPRATPVTITYRPKCFLVGTKLAALSHEGLASGNLHYWTWDSATPTVPPALVGTLIANCQGDDAYRTYDAASALGASYFWTANIRSGRQYVDLRKWNSAYALQLSGTILGTAGDDTYRTCAMCYDGNTASIYTLIVKRLAGPPIQEQLWLVKSSAATLLDDWSLLLFTGIAAGELDCELIHTLGVCVDTAAGRVVSVWTTRTQQALLTVTCDMERTYSVACTAAGASVSGTRILQNELLLTRPWVQDGRCYVVTVSDVAWGEGLPRSAFATNCMWELDNYGAGEGGPDSGQRRYWPAGVHDVGSAAHLYIASAPYGEGAANNVFGLTQTSPRRWAYANHSRSETSFWYASSSQEAIKRAVDLVVLDYDFVPEVAVMQDGCAYISGSYGTWYDGTTVTECHVPTPPFVTGGHTGHVAGPAGHLADGTYNYALMWLGRDDAGVIHRNLVFAGLDIEVDGGASENAARFFVRTVGFTDRWWPSDLLLCAIYRADATGVFYRADAPLLTRNDDTTGYLTVTDYGAYTTEMLYTQGGALESVCPEGFEHLTVHNERIFTAGHYRRVRAQYSKRFTAGTASELLFAPEFHEALGVILPEDFEARGIAGLDDKVVFFSDARIYALAGVGPDDAGLGSDYSQLALISGDCGCDDSRSIASFPGGVAFIGGGRLRVLTRSLEVQVVGEAVRDTLAEYPEVVAVDVMADKGQIRWLLRNGAKTSGKMIVWDYERGEWFVWVVKDDVGLAVPASSSVVHLGEHFIVDGADLYRQRDLNDYHDHTAGLTWIKFEVGTQWIQPAGLGGWQRITDVLLTGEYLDAHNVTVSIANDFLPGPVSQSATWSDAQLQALPQWNYGKREQLKLKCKIQKTQAIQVRVVDDAPGSGSPSGASVRLTALGLRVGRKPVFAKLGSAQQR